MFLPLFSFSQQVKNVHFEQVGKQIHIYYDLTGTGTYMVKVYCSTNDGNSWGNPLQSVNGAVGNEIKPGNKKKVVWDVLKYKEKLIGELKFRIVVFSENEKQNVNTFSQDGNIYFEKNNVIKRITSLGVDYNPLFYDENNIVFYREKGESFEEHGFYVKIEILMYDLKKMNLKVLDAHYKSGSHAIWIAKEGIFILSPDKNYLYIEGIGYSVAGAINQYSFKTSEIKEITSYINNGNNKGFNIIKSGKYKNYLLVYRSYFRYNSKGESSGRQWQWYLLNEKGQVIKELGDDLAKVQQFMDRNNCGIKLKQNYD